MGEETETKIVGRGIRTQIYQQNIVTLQNSPFFLKYSELNFFVKKNYITTLCIFCKHIKYWKKMGLKRL
jgi:hypothetical protein